MTEIVYEPCRVDLVIDYKERLLDEFTRFDRLPVTGERTTEIVQIVADILKVPDELARSVAIGLGATYSRAVLQAVAWRAAGNFQRLRGGREVYDWRSCPYQEWVAACFLEARPARLGVQKARSLNYRVLSGSPAGVKSDLTLSLRAWRFFAKAASFRPAGRDSADEYEDPGQYVGLFFEALIPAAKRPRDVFRAETIRFPARFKGRNADLRKSRRKEGPIRCQVKGEVACHRCPLGRDRCEAATHVKTYEFRQCSKCEKVKAHDGESAVCLGCQAAEIYQGKV
jgi:hypothetical protein